MNNAATATNQAKTMKPIKRSKASIVKEHLPVEGGRVHGVTFDRTLVWFARHEEIVGLDPESGAIVRRIAVPAKAGTTFDGESFYQIAGDTIYVVRPSDGKVLRTMKAPSFDDSSGMAYAD